MVLGQNPFKRCIELAPLVFTVAFLTYILGLLFDTAIGLIPILVVLIFFVPIKIYLYSGVYGHLVELLSGDEIAFQFKQIHLNAKRFWKVYAIVLALPLVLDWLLKMFVPQGIVSFSQVLAQTQIILLTFISFWIIQEKYVGPFKLNQRPITVTLEEATVILGLFMLESIIIFLPLWVQTPWRYFANVSGFIREGLEYLQFTYISLVILKNYKEIENHFATQKEIYLISPVNAGVRDSFGSVFYKPYPGAFVVLKALTPKHYRFRVFNRRFWQDRYYGANKLVAITCFTGNSFEAYKIAKEFKRRGSTVIMGGPHVTYLPDEALEYCDSVVIGEAEGIWKQVMADYENKTLKKKYNGVAVENYHQEVHEELLNSPPNIIKDFLETTRGCKFKCHFCTIPGLSSGRTRTKPTFELVELIKKIRQKYSSVYFIDNNIYSDPAYAKALFEELKPLKIRWRTACTIDIAKNEEMLKLAKDSGCELLLFGYEIFGSSAESAQRGKFGMAEKYIQFTRKVKQMGIQIKGSFVYGWDTDRLKDLWTLWKFCSTIRPEITVINLLTPIPGSHTYDDMIKKNCITNLNWRSYSFHNFVFKHDHINTHFVDMIFPVLRPFFVFTTSRIGFMASAVLLVCMALIFIFHF